MSGFGFPQLRHFVVYGDIEWDIHMWLMIVSRSETVSWESWLLVISRTGCSDSRHWPPSSTYPLSHWHRRQLYNYPVLTSSHVSSIPPLSGDLSDKSRHSHEHLPLSSDKRPGDRWNLLSILIGPHPVIMSVEVMRQAAVGQCDIMGPG